MALQGTIAIRCHSCGTEQDCPLVQSINARKDAAHKQALLAGTLNVLDCACGRRTPIACTVLYSDPDAAYLCQVCPDGEAGMARGEAAFAASGATGRMRLVPSLNALVEKVKLLDAGLEDWGAEMLKVLLLAAGPAPDLERILLFDRVSADGGVIHWVELVPGAPPRVLASPLDAYAKLVAGTAGPSPREHRIDRAWAVEAVREMIARAN